MDRTTATGVQTRVPFENFREGPCKSAACISSEKLHDAKYPVSFCVFFLHAMLTMVNYFVNMSNLTIIRNLKLQSFNMYT